MKKKAIVLGTGESAKHYKEDLFHFVIGINDAVKLGYKLDAIAYTDSWQRVSTTRPLILNTPKEVIKFNRLNDCPMPNSNHIKSVRHVKNGSFNIDRRPISHGCSSALYAICIASMWGYNEIEVFGVDLVTHKAMSAQFIQKNKDITKVPLFSESGKNTVEKWGSDFCLHNSITELYLLRRFLEKKKIKMALTEYSPISKIVNND